MSPNRRLLLLFGCCLAACILLCAPASEAGKAPSPPRAFTLNGTQWTIHKSAEGRAFFQNMATGNTQWEDPRKEELTTKDKVIAVTLFMSPFLLIFGAGCAYLLHVYRTQPKLMFKPKKQKGRKPGTPIIRREKDGALSDGSDKKAK